ncbi:MAG: hypothetical protein POELPBGB_02291 [Bacteroidia bacterium]|nr:hypothetical protein [Bacteroidia bacterium]
MKKVYTTFLSLLALTSAMAQVPIPTTGLVSEYTFTGNADDGVGTVDGAVTGATLTTDRFGNASSAYNLASNQFIGLGDNFDNITTGSSANFTFSFWVKFGSVNSAYHSIISKASFETLCTTAGRQFTVRLNDANKLEFTGYGSIAAGNYITYQTASTLSAGQWYHVVIGVDMANLSAGNISTGLKVYLNNTLQTMSQATLVGGGLGSGINNGPAHIGIGAFLGTTGALCSATQFLEGAFDDFRIYNRVVTAQEANDLYYENVQQEGLVSRYSFDAGDATDDAGTNDGTVVGATLTTDRFGNPNQAYSFDGNDYINCGNNGSWNLLLTPGVTMSAWVKTNATFGASLAGILTRWGGISSGDEYAFFLANTTGRPTMTINTPSVNGVAATTNINDNQWHQVVFTFDKATGVHKMYIDGVQVYTNTIAGGIATISVPQSVLIGAQWGNGTPGRFFNGSIDDIGVYAGALSAQEVTVLYNAEAFGCTPASITQNLSGVNYICPEVGSVDLSVTATGDNLTYQWQSSPNGSTWTDINGAESATYSATAANYYQVIVSSTCGSPATSAIAQVISANANNVTTILQNGNGTICSGDFVTILTQVTIASSFLWTPDGQTTSSITVNPAQTTTYEVTATANATGCVGTAQRTITVIPDLDNYPVTFNAGYIEIGDTLSDIQWYVDGNLVSGANSYSYLPAVNGSYTATFTYMGCSYTTASYFYVYVGAEEATASRFSVFPNPTSGNISIETAEGGNFVLSNIVGETLYAQQIQNKAVISLESFAAGVYFLTEVNSGKTVKIVKE